PEAVHRAAGSDVESVIDDRGCGITLVLEIVERENFPLAIGLEHGHLALLARDVNVAGARDRRGIVRVERARKTTLFEYLSGVRVEAGENPAVLDQVQHASIEQRRGN